MHRGQDQAGDGDAVQQTHGTACQRQSPVGKRGDVFWITYNKLVEEPEDIVEEHELNGECLHCKDCPYCDRVVDIYGNKDARVKWGKCTRYGMVSVNLNKKVCAAYWESEERR